MPDRAQPRSRDAFQIAVICAMDFEFDAAEAMLDQHWEENDQLYSRASGDDNAYRTGRIGNFNVVLVQLPGMGKTNASTAGDNLYLSFRNIRLCLIVGICGGIPFRRPDIKDGKITEIVLGDVITSTAVVQHDFGRRRQDKFVRKDTHQDNLPRAPDVIRSFLRIAKTKRTLKLLEQRISKYSDSLLEQEGFEASMYPGADKDILYEPTYRHKHQDKNASCICAKCDKPDDAVCPLASETTSTCVDLKCDASKQVPRFRLLSGTNPSKPRVHFGAVASGDSVMQSAYHRDEIVSDEEEEIIAFEMEGAGVWGKKYPTIVIKGVSDYSDSHKNYYWQAYAAATAASAMKAFIQMWRETDEPGQPVAEHSAADIQESEVMETTRRDPETQSHWLALKQGAAKEMVVYAYSLLDQRDQTSTKEDFESMRQAFLRARSALLTTPDSSLLQDTFWALMLVEMDLSCCTCFEISQKEQHLREAEKYNAELVKSRQHSPNITIKAQIMIGQHLIHAIKASLYSKSQEGVKDKAKKSLTDADNGMERELRELQMVDPASYNEFWKVVSAWRKLLWDDIC